VMPIESVEKSYFAWILAETTPGGPEQGESE
jgi:hypothetical protein